MSPPSLSGTRVLVTGGAGFIGSALAHELGPRTELTVIDDLSNGRRAYVPDAAEFVRGDVREAETVDAHVAEADVVFHEAAIPSVERSVEDPLACHEVNADATIELLEAARKHDTRVVVASSAAVYGHPKHLPIAESDPKTPTSPYGIDKLSVDHYARRYHDLYGLETVTLRYFNVYGPRQTASSYAGVITVFREQALANDPITVDGDGSQTRDFVHVDDVVRANLLAAETDAVGEAYNVGTGRETSIRTLAETVRAVSDATADIVHTDPRPGDINHSVADISKARAKLDYEPTIGLREGLGTLVDSNGG